MEQHQHQLLSKQDLNKIFELGECIYNLKKKTIPDVCCAIYPIAQAAASFTDGSKSSRHATKAGKAFESTTACDKAGVCLATARKTKAAAFL